jgi:Mn2+/Fe2+ NRAMP family transporter
VVGLFELGFVLIAWTLHPSFAVLAADLRDQPLGDPGYLWLGAALIGATFNPWMIFYQGSALAERRLGASHYPAARWDTWIGAILTQLLTAAVLLAAAAAMGQGGGRAPLASVGQISQILTPVLGSGLGRLLFGLGVVGASLAAAIVCALACIWGLGELFGPARTGSAGALWFKLGTVAFIGSGALTVLGVRDLVRLSVALQVINAVLLPVVVALLFGLAATALPAEARPGRRVFGLAASAAAAVCAAGLVGAGASLF